MLRTLEDTGGRCSRATSETPTTPQLISRLAATSFGEAQGGVSGPGEGIRTREGYQDQGRVSGPGIKTRCRWLHGTGRGPRQPEEVPD
jgi:hypothetical protein